MSTIGTLLQPTVGVDVRADLLQLTSGTIIGFKDYAIRMAGNRNVVEGMRLVSNGTGVYVAGLGSRIRNNTIVHNNEGIDCASCLIEQNLVTGNIFGVSEDDGGVVLGNVIALNGGPGLLVYTFGGYGNNLLFGNNAGGAQVTGPAVQLHSNVCEPACL
jgi:hypothetical protein